MIKKKKNKIMEYLYNFSQFSRGAKIKVCTTTFKYFKTCTTKCYIGKSLQIICTIEHWVFQQTNGS